MRYVVTGSAGFIGHHLCQALLESGVAVDGMDAFTDHYDPSLKRANAARLARYDRYRSVELDLVTAELDDVLSGADAVIHLAAQPGVRQSWADGFPVYLERNVTASQRLLEAARRTRVPRLVLASSSSVYGNAIGAPTIEGAPTSPFSPYGVTKLAMEHLASAYAENWGLSIAVLRYFTVYGPGQRPDMALHRFIAALAADEPVIIYGDGEQVRDLTYVADAAAAAIAAAAADVPSGTPVFNVAGGSPTTISNVLRIASEHIGRRATVRHVPEQPGDVRATSGNTDRARRLLGWWPEVPLDEGIKRQVVHQLGEDRRSGL
jgi:nucleoside-diphosphate-sugar epimerase